jgi:hypothetical protein
VAIASETPSTGRVCAHPRRCIFVRFEDVGSWTRQRNRICCAILPNLAAALSTVQPMDIGLPETEQELEITPLEEPVPAPSPVEEPAEEPVPA